MKEDPRKQGEEISNKKILENIDKILGLTVFSVKERKELGKLKDCLIDKSKMSITAFLVEVVAGNGFELKVLPFDKIHSLGVDAVVVVSENELYEQEKTAEFGESLNKDLKLVGKKVQTDTDKKIGIVSGLKLDVSTGKLSSLEIKPHDAPEKRKEIPIERLTIKPDILVVNNKEQVIPVATINRSKPKIVQKPKPKPTKRSKLKKQDEPFIKQHSNKIFLIFLVLAASIILYIRLQIQFERGPGWDTYAFLLNGLEFAGEGKDYFEIYRPPFLSAVIAIIFKLGFVSETVIYLTDAAITLIGTIGLYFLFRLRFVPSISFLGSLLFFSFPDIMENLTQGITDIISLVLSIIAVYVVVRAVEDDSRYFYFIIPLLVLCFLSRFSAALMILPVLFYISVRPKKEKYLQKLFSGGLWSLIVLVPYFIYYWVRLGDPLIQIGEPYKSASATTRVSLLAGPIEPSTYFVSNFLNFLGTSPLKYIFLILVITGFFIFVSSLIKQKKQTKTSYLIMLALAGIFLVVLFFVKINFMFVNIIWYIYLGSIVTIFFKLDKKAAIGLLFLFWFVVFFNTHSHLLVKITRYYLTIVPPVIFFILLSFDKLNELLQGKKFGARLVFVVAISFSIILTSFSVYSSYKWLESTRDWGLYGMEEVSDWFNRVEKRQNLNLVSDTYVAYRWHLKKKVLVMPPLEGDRFNHELEAINADYFFTVHNINKLKSYKEVKRIKNAIVYKKTGSRPTGSKDIFLIGRDLDNYIYDIIGLNKYYVTRKKLPYPDALADVSGTYIDDYELDQLKNYDAIILYNFRWHDQKKSEDLIKRYVAAGGHVIIDASRTLDGLSNNLNNAFFLDVQIQQESLPKKPKISISNKALARDVERDRFSPFLTEEGEIWHGADYKNSNNNLQVLVKADDKILVATQKIGKGKLIWVGYNMFFHSFYYENEDEMQLVRNIFSLISAEQNK